MLTVQEFNEKMTTLERYYDKEFNQEERRIWYEELKDKFDADDMAVMGNLIIRAFDRLPKYSQVQGVIENVLNLKHKVEQEQMADQIEEYTYVKCPHCKNTGLIPYTKLVHGTPYQYYAKCICENVQNIPFRDRLIDARQLQLI